MYSAKYVLSVLDSSGKPLKEFADNTVNIPFGEDYGLRLRNKNDKRCVVKITIDGENVSDGGFVVNANDHVDIYRFASKNRKFKFVDLNSDEAADSGKDLSNGDKEMGVIEARFYPERLAQPAKVIYEYIYRDYFRPRPWRQPNTYPPMYTQVTYKSCLNRLGGLSGVVSLMANSSIPLNCSTTSPTTNLDQETSVGCTVEGDKSKQKFSTTHLDVEENYVALKIVLKGTVRGATDNSEEIEQLYKEMARISKKLESLAKS